MSQLRLAEAEPVYRESLQGWRDAVGDDHPNTLRLAGNLGHMLVVAGRPKEAEPFLRMQAEGLPKALGPDHPDVAHAQTNLAEALEMQGRFTEALPLLTTALEAQRRKLPPKHMDTGDTLERYGRCLTGLQRYEEAQAALAEADDIISSVAGDRKPRRGPVLRDYISLYKAWGKPDEVARWQAEQEKFNKENPPAPAATGVAAAKPVKGAP
jgi:tetratricopeptide (TPR) repeat protein